MTDFFHYKKLIIILVKGIPESFIGSRWMEKCEI